MCGYNKTGSKLETGMEWYLNLDNWAMYILMDSYSRSYPCFKRVVLDDWTSWIDSYRTLFLSANAMVTVDN